MNIHESVPADKAINALIDLLNNDKEHLKESTKLTLTDINKLAELCPSECYFLHENSLCMLLKGGPIGISLMVVLSEFYLQKTKCKGYMETLNYKIAQKKLKRFVDKSHTRF